MLSETVVCSEQRQRVQTRKGEVVEEGVRGRLGRVEFYGPVDAVVEHGVSAGVYEAVDILFPELSEIPDLVMLHYLLPQRCHVAGAIPKNAQLQWQN